MSETKDTSDSEGFRILLPFFGVAISDGENMKDLNSIGSVSRESDCEIDLSGSICAQENEDSLVNYGKKISGEFAWIERNTNSSAMVVTNVMRKISECLVSLASSKNDYLPIHSWAQYGHVLGDPSSKRELVFYQKDIYQTTGHYVCKISDRIGLWLSFRNRLVENTLDIVTCMFDSVVIFETSTGTITGCMLTDSKTKRLCPRNANEIVLHLIKAMRDLINHLSSGRCSSKYHSYNNSSMEFTHYSLEHNRYGSPFIRYLFSEIEFKSCGIVARVFDTVSCEFTYQRFQHNFFEIFPSMFGEYHYVEKKKAAFPHISQKSASKKNHRAQERTKKTRQKNNK